MSCFFLLYTTLKSGVLSLRQSKLSSFMESMIFLNDYKNKFSLTIISTWQFHRGKKKLVICYLNIQQTFFFQFLKSKLPCKTHHGLFLFFTHDILFKTGFMLYSVCRVPGKHTPILKIDESNYIHAILNRCYSSISSNKDLELGQL